MNIALYGSGEFMESVNEIDRYLIEKYKLKTVAVIPTAAGKEHDYHKWIDMAQSHYANFKINVVPVPVINALDANDSALVKLLDQADWIFFSGGSPKYLLDTLKDSKLWDKVIQRVNEGALLAGSSAGAMIMGNYLLESPFKAVFSSLPANWDKAFKLVDFTVFPHFNKLKKYNKVISKVIKKAPPEVRNSWIGIEENTALIIDNDGSRIKGIGTVDIHSQEVSLIE